MHRLLLFIFVILFSIQSYCQQLNGIDLIGDFYQATVTVDQDFNKCIKDNCVGKLCDDCSYQSSVYAI